MMGSGEVLKTVFLVSNENSVVKENVSEDKKLSEFKIHSETCESVPSLISE